MSAAVLYPMAALCAATGVFAWRQNRGGVVGGPISWPKILWLNYTLIVFFVLPACLWRNAALHPELRALFGWLFLSFSARAVIELWLIYVTISWRCAYGIGHDAFTFLLAAGLRWLLPPAAAAADERALVFLTAYQAVLAVEAFMAWRFSRRANPREGIYFADDSEKFRFINRATIAAVTAGYAQLIFWLWTARNDFS